MKRFISAFMAILMVMSIVLAAYPMEAKAATSSPVYSLSSVQSISIPDMTIPLQTSGYWESYTDRFGNTTQGAWFHYRPEPSTVVVTFTDGSKKSFGQADLYTNFGVYLTTSDTQTYATRWMEGGKYRASASLGSVSTQFYVTIGSSPLKAIYPETLVIETDWDRHYGDAYSITYDGYVVLEYKDGTRVRWAMYELNMFSGFFAKIAYPNGDHYTLTKGTTTLQVTIGGITADWKVIGADNVLDYLNSSSVYGWYYANGYYYYTTGTAYVDQWLNQNGKWYYFDYQGRMAVGRKGIVSNSSSDYRLDYYFFGEDGARKTGWINDLGKWYYYDPALVEGWKQISGKWYYFIEEQTDGSYGFNRDFGVMKTGWMQQRGVWYYLGSDGAMTTGWKQISGTWYYFDGSGAMTTGWKQISGKWYYFNGSGAMATGWKQINGKWYYLNSEMKTGWTQVGSTWYYLGGDGIMKTGWQNVGGSWYYLGSDGGMKTGWQNVSGIWYYLGSNGVMTTGWKQISGTWYYFKSSGAMACSETLKIGGTSYSFAASGAWIH